VGICVVLDLSEIVAETESDQRSTFGMVWPSHKGESILDQVPMWWVWNQEKAKATILLLLLLLTHDAPLFDKLNIAYITY